MLYENRVLRRHLYKRIIRNDHVMVIILLFLCKTACLNRSHNLTVFYQTKWYFEIPFGLDKTQSNCGSDLSKEL